MADDAGAPTVIAIGLDGYRHGWVAVSIDGDRRDIAFAGDIDWLAGRRFTCAAIDIPIGMNDDGERICDALARKALAPHGARVFGGARRWLWEDFCDPAKANIEAARRRQKKVSRQLWHLGPKIMEVDRFIRAQRDPDIREAHPELVFLRLNGGKPLLSKHTDEGVAHRRRLLLDDGFSELDDWLESTRIGTGAKRDDVLDACACAIAARDLVGCLPEGEAPRDAPGLPMQIWF